MTIDYDDLDRYEKVAKGVKCSKCHVCGIYPTLKMHLGHPAWAHWKEEVDIWLQFDCMCGWGNMPNMTVDIDDDWVSLPTPWVMVKSLTNGHSTALSEDILEAVDKFNTLQKQLKKLLRRGKIKVIEEAITKYKILKLVEYEMGKLHAYHVEHVVDLEGAKMPWDHLVNAVTKKVLEEMK